MLYNSQDGTPKQSIVQPKIQIVQGLRHPEKPELFSLLPPGVTVDLEYRDSEVMETCACAADTARKPARLRVPCDISQVKTAQAYCRGAGTGWQSRVGRVDTQATQTA